VDNDEQLYREAERAFLESEGIAATEQLVELKRLGSQLRVVTAGEGPPVVFVSGTMTTAVSYAPLVRNLPDYRCIMIDRPGTGLSPVPEPKPEKMEDHQRVADALLVDLLDGLNIDKAHVVCASMGGWPTFRSAAAHPDRFSRIFAMSWQQGARVTSVPLSMRMPMPKAMTPKRIPFGGRRLVKTMLKSAGMKKAVSNGAFSDEMLDYLVAVGRHTSTMYNDANHMPVPVGPMGGVKAVEHRPELLARVAAPVHLFWGTDDIFGSPESAREFAAGFPNAELQLVEGAGHAPWMDEPDLALESLRSHFAH
jgi:pimeloyl-ACP methyl ester carboxylesterase